ncbi:hypothetical protein [Microbulbifer hydrolyticus]|uniref:DUF3757 domain-containing protein n=1 Tax=Microbulbifer hydrolyticus TaxID=48074 RepID=A0A6P1T9K0_9GAMM|nr:hypothetical protein [Microbulbifer hydrolyticus]MBB5213237.1 hypothetical protein [Microbulbifer hydrolyticus]QHQ38501.1 hypothetical protein GTQ55_05500 [Microbulbifer hydrolyticus]
MKYLILLFLLIPLHGYSSGKSIPEAYWGTWDRHCKHGIAATDSIVHIREDVIYGYEEKKDILSVAFSDENKIEVEYIFIYDGVENTGSYKWELRGQSLVSIHPKTGNEWVIHKCEAYEP